MTKVCASLRRTFRLRLILALMPVISLLGMVGRAVASRSYSDITSGCVLQESNVSVERGHSYLFGTYILSLWQVDKYRNTSTNAYYYRLVIGPLRDDWFTDYPWSYSCTNGASW